MATQDARATFTGVEETIDVTWPAMAGDYGITYGVTLGAGVGPTAVWLTSVTSAGATVHAYAGFVGVVDLQIWDRV